MTEIEQIEALAGEAADHFLKQAKQARPNTAPPTDVICGEFMKIYGLIERLAGEISRTKQQPEHQS